MKSTNADNKRLSDLILKAKGGRSYRQYAQDAGVSYASISRILKGDYVPSARTLKKLTSEEANPQGGVTYEDLMVAAGFRQTPDFNMWGITKDDVPEEKKENNTTLHKKPLKPDDSLRKQRLEQYYAIIRGFSAKGEGAIYKAAIENGLQIGAIDTKASHDDMEKQFDVKIIVHGHSIQKWYFDFFVFIKKASYITASYRIREHVARYAIHKPDSKRKISIVFNDRESFDIARECAGELSLRADVSAVLIDEEKIEVVDEVYLSHYMENEADDEIYLVPPKH